MGDHFIYEKNDATPLYRVFKIDHLKGWLANGELYFPRPQNWEDPFENILLKQKYHRACTTTVMDFSNVLDHFFGQCWTNAAGETDATWRIYAPESNGVRIGTTVERMYAALEKAATKFKSDCYVCRVDYFDAAEILKRASLAMQTLQAIHDDGESCLTLLTVKRPEFGHESEVRLILHDKSGGVLAADKFILVPVDPRDVITSVTLDPRLDDATFAGLKAEFEALLPGIDVVQSQLYRLDAASVPIYELEDTWKGG